VKIEINKIPPGGFTLAEDISASSLGLETDIIKFRGPIRIKADVSKITNTVSVALTLNALMLMQCGRCLNDFSLDLKKDLKLNYPVDKSELIIDLDEDIRQEIILDYPLKPLCSQNCKGLCPKCGKNLNEGGCSCATT
jgi:uncharacterized protein